VVIAIYFFKKLYIGRSYVCTIYRHNSQIYYMGCGTSVLPKCPMLWMLADIYSRRPIVVFLCKIIVLLLNGPQRCLPVKTGGF
jgi:hypothetical protein